MQESFGSSSRRPQNLDVAIGHRIRDRRRQLGWSQLQLAESVGVSFQQIQKYENGTNRISFSRLLEIAHALECNLGDLTAGLDIPSAGKDLDRLNELLATEGALDLLDAYKALGGKDLRRAVLSHVKSLAQVVGGSERG